MLSLDKLSIKGFKSFVEPTDFEIKNGLTGIVGPNGCGKSNIVEAIRFGLGEVSAKQLRGKEIDDLIFNGTDNRPSWNIAEVGLFVNIEGSDLENKFESKQLEIARKIWRGEGTNSFINGKEVRLKDIQLLFADASTSARSTSIVSQGRIGAITQAKPEDRKMVLEEAAGILGLQSRRHDAELRLKGANNNLLRVEDVIETYEEQLAILKKQAKEAERFRNISTLIKNAEASVFFVKRNKLQLIIKKLNEEKDKIKIKLADFQGDVSIQDQAYEDLKVKIPPMREKSYSLNSELDRLNMTVENLKQEELRFEEHKINLEHRVKQLNQDLQIEQKQFEDTNNKIKTIKKDIEDLSSKEFEAENRDNPINQSDKSLLNNISFDKKYENAVAGFFGGLPNTSFSQNVGIVGMTGVMSRHVVTLGAIVLVICGLIPKIGAVIASMPLPVLGGGVIVMFGMVVAAGLNVLSDVNLNRRNMVIIAVSLAVGLGLNLVPSAVQYLPGIVKVLATSAVAPTALVAVILNLVLPEED